MENYSTNTHNYNWRSRSRSKLAPLESFAEQNNGNVPTWPTEPEDNGRREREAEETVLVLNQIRSHARTHTQTIQNTSLFIKQTHTHTKFDDAREKKIENITLTHPHNELVLTMKEEEDGKFRRKQWLKKA